MPQKKKATRRKKKKNSGNPITALTARDVQPLPNHEVPPHGKWYKGDMPTRKECLERILMMHDLPLNKIRASDIDARAKLLYAFMSAMGFDKPEVDKDQLAVIYMTEFDNALEWGDKAFQQQKDLTDRLREQAKSSQLDVQ